MRALSEGIPANDRLAAARLLAPVAERSGPRFYRSRLRKEAGAVRGFETMRRAYALPADRTRYHQLLAAQMYQLPARFKPRFGALLTGPDDNDFGTQYLSELGTMAAATGNGNYIDPDYASELGAIALASNKPAPAGTTQDTQTPRSASSGWSNMFTALFTPISEAFGRRIGGQRGPQVVVQKDDTPGWVGPALIGGAIGIPLILLATSKR